MLTNNQCKQCQINGKTYQTECNADDVRGVEHRLFKPPWLLAKAIDFESCVADDILWHQRRGDVEVHALEVEANADAEGLDVTLLQTLFRSKCITEEGLYTWLTGLQVVGQIAIAPQNMKNQLCKILCNFTIYLLELKCKFASPEQNLPNIDRNKQAVAVHPRWRGSSSIPDSSTGDSWSRRTEQRSSSRLLRRTSTSQSHHSQCPKIMVCKFLEYFQEFSGGIFINFKEFLMWNYNKNDGIFFKKYKYTFLLKITMVFHASFYSLYFFTATRHFHRNAATYPQFSGDFIIFQQISRREIELQGFSKFSSSGHPGLMLHSVHWRILIQNKNVWLLMWI